MRCLLNAVIMNGSFFETNIGTIGVLNICLIS